MVHLQDHDLILIHDRVTATSEQYAKKWLLHMWTKPVTGTERVLRGSEHNGILESLDSEAVIEHEDAVLRVVRMLPEDAVLRKVGGPEYRFYVEPDGIDLAGRNMAEGVRDQPWYDAGLWRLEIQPQPGNRFDRFLVVLQVGVEDQFEPVACEMIENEKVVGTVLPGHVVLFGKEGIWEGTTTYTVPQGGARKNIVVDLPPALQIRVTVGGRAIPARSSAEGVLVFDVDAHSRDVDVVVSVHSKDS